MSESDELDTIRERKRQELVDRASSSAGTDATPSPSEPVPVDSQAALEELVATHPVVLVDCYADWCGPCQLLEPIVRELAQDTDAAVAKVDVDALPGVARELQVQGVPTLFLYVDGDPAERLVGVQDYGTLEALISRHA